MKKGYRLFPLIMVVVLTLVSGCGFKDIDKRFFAVTIGIDSGTDEQHKYKVSLKLAIPSPTESFGSNQFLMVSYEADSVTEAVRRMKSMVDKEIDFGHAKAIIYGEKVLDDPAALPETMDWLMRRRDIQKIAWVAVGNPDALTIMNKKPKTERLPSNMLFLAFGHVGTETPYIMSEYLFDFYRRMHERGMDPMMPIITSREDGQVAIDKLTLFQKNKRAITLQPEETKILNSLISRIGKVDLKVKSPDTDFILAIDHVQTNYHVLDDGQPRLAISLNLAGVVEETHLPINHKKLPDYERQSEKVVRERVTALIRKLQQANVDPIGFGLNYRAKRKMSPADWERWQDMYPSLDVDVQAKVTIRSTGVME